MYLQHFVFGIDRCSVYTGELNIDFLHLDFLSSVYTGYQFIQGSVQTDFHCIFWIRSHTEYKFHTCTPQSSNENIVFIGCSDLMIWEDENNICTC